MKPSRSDPRRAAAKWGGAVSENSCIFCKIAAGAISALRVFESPDAVAFLDIAPLAPGHTLLIPRQHFQSILDVPPDVLGRLVGHLPLLARAVMKVSGATGLNVLQNTGESSGQAVFHLHFHLIPRNEEDRLGFRWNAGAYGPGEDKAMQAGLLQSLKAH